MATITPEMLSIWSKPPNVPGAVNFGYFRDATDLRWSERVDNAEECTVVVPLASRASVFAVVRRVLVLELAPAPGSVVGETRMFRITGVDREQSSGGVRLVISARSLAIDLTDCGPVRDVLAGGRELFTIAGTLNLAQWLDTYILPQLARAGYDYYVRTATVNAITSSQIFDQATPREVLDAHLATIEQEWAVVPTGATIALDFSTASVAQSLAPLRITTGHNLRRLVQKTASIDQATILQPTGGLGHSEASRTIQHHRLAILGTVDTVNHSFDVGPMPGDVSGWSWPIVRRDGQWVGYYMQHVQTGRCFPIIASLASGLAGRVTVDDATTLAPGVQFELRRALTPGTRIDAPTPGYPLRIQALAGATLTLENALAAPDPVPTDGVHIDCRIAPAFQVLSTTSSAVLAVAGSTVAQDVTCASTAGVQVGDWGFLHSSVGTPWTLVGKVCTVMQVVSGTVVRVVSRYSFDAALPFSVGAAARQAKFYRARALSPYVQTETAATNQITVTSAGGLAVNDLIEYHQDNSGATVSALHSPTSAPIASGGYGAVERSAAFPYARSVVNLLSAGNPWFDQWAVPASPPDQWTKVSGSTITRIASGLPGPGTIYAAELRSIAIRSPVVYLRPTAGDSQVSVRVRFRTGSAGNWDGANFDTFIVSIRAGTTGATIALAIYCPPGYPSKPPGYIEVAPLTTVDADLLAVDLLHTPGAGFQYAPWHGITVTLESTGTMSTAIVTVGGVLLVQDSTLPVAGTHVQYSDQSLFGLGQVRHATIDAPETAYDADAVDLGRLLSSTFAAEELVKGRAVRVESDTLGVAFDGRIVALEFTGGAEGETRVSVDTGLRDISDVLAARLLGVERASGAASIGGASTGTPASSLPIGGVLPGELSLSGLGYTPSDTVDQQANLQSALDQARIQKKGLFIDPGIWRWSGSLRQLNCPWVRGIPAESILKPLVGVPRTCYSIETTILAGYAVGSTKTSELQNVSFDGTDATSCTLVRAGGVETTSTATSVSGRVIIDRTEIMYCTGAGAVGLRVANTVGLLLKGCYIGRNDTNVVVEGYQIDLPTTTLVSHTHIREAVGHGVILRLAYGIQFTDMCVIEANGMAGILAQPGTNQNVTSFTVDNSWVEDNWRIYAADTPQRIQQFGIDVNGLGTNATVTARIVNNKQNGNPNTDRFLRLVRATDFVVEDNDFYPNIASIDIQSSSVGRVWNTKRSSGLTAKQLCKVDTSSAGLVTFGPEFEAAFGGVHMQMAGYHFWVDATAKLRMKAGAPTTDLDGRAVGVPEYAWNADHFMMGTYHLWLDTNERLRVNPTAPTSDFDGHPVQYYVPSYNSAAHEQLTLGGTGGTTGWRIWIGAANELRVKDSAPTSISDGVAIDSTRQTVEGFYGANVVFSAAGDLARHGRTEWLAAEAGSLRKLVVRLTDAGALAPLTAGTLTVTVKKNGVAALSGVLGAGASTATFTAVSGTWTYVTGDRLTVSYVTNAAFLPTGTIDIDVALLVEFP